MQTPAVPLWDLVSAILSYPILSPCVTTMATSAMSGRDKRDLGIDGLADGLLGWQLTYVVVIGKSKKLVVRNKNQHAWNQDLITYETEIQTQQKPNQEMIGAHDFVFAFSKFIFAIHDSVFAHHALVCASDDVVSAEAHLISSTFVLFTCLLVPFLAVLSFVGDDNDHWQNIVAPPANPKQLNKSEKDTYKRRLPRIRTLSESTV